MKGIESVAALSQLQAYARRVQRQGETMGEAFIRACSERPDYYRAYDNARLDEAQRGEVQEHLQPQPETLRELSEFGKEQAHVLQEIEQEAHKHSPTMTASEYATGEGRHSKVVKVYDEMVKRGVRRAVAERNIG